MAPTVYGSDNRRSGLYIIGGGNRAVDPETLAAAHPVWEHDFSRFGPWKIEKNTHLPQQFAPVWRAENYHRPSAVYITGRCPSTMDVAREMVQCKCLEPWGSILAIEQTAGRGQKKRRWISPPGNIYGSWYWPRIDALPKQSAASWHPLASLLAGAVMASGLEDRGLSVRIKWPNDLVIGDRKVCGLLVEDRGGELIVGTGINVISAPGDHLLRDDFVLPATRIRELLPTVTPLDLWLHLMESGRQRVENIVLSMAPEEFVQMLERRMAWIGRRVMVRRGEAEAFEAVFTGLAEDGGLRIRRGSATETLYTGSLLPID